MGEAQLSNTNKSAFIAEAGLSPIKKMAVNVMYIKHQLDEKYIGVSGSRRALGTTNWADEFNLFIEYDFTDNIWGHFGAGYTLPNGAAKEFYGNDDNALFTQIWMKFRF